MRIYEYMSDLCACAYERTMDIGRFLIVLLYFILFSILLLKCCLQFYGSSGKTIPHCKIQ